MTTPDNQVHLLHMLSAHEHVLAYLEDDKVTGAERKAALTCKTLVQGLLALEGDELNERIDAVLCTLESLHLADTVGRPASHVYRTTYRALAGR